MNNNDLISRAWVLAEYDRQHKGPPGGARKIMEEAPAVDAVPVVQRWISVNDRLPVDMGTVLIAHKGGVSFGWFNGSYWTRGAATKHKPIKTVTHWMPLPEPPKMDGDANG